MGNAHTLVPTVMTFDTWLKCGIQIEDFMKQEEGVRTEDPISTLRDYLNGTKVA